MHSSRPGYRSAPDAGGAAGGGASSVALRPQAGRGFSGRVLPAVLTGASCVFLVGAVVVACMRLGYPYELEWLEGAVLQSISHILRGQPLYPPPSLSYTPLNYPPLYYYVSAAVMLVIGEGFFAMRAVSLASSIATFAMIFFFVRRVTGRSWAGALAAGLFASCYRAGGTWFDVGRLDALSLALLVGGVMALDLDRSRWRGPAVAAGLVVLSFLAKPTTIAMFMPVLAWCALEDRARGLRLAVLLGAFLLASVLALDWMTAGGFSYYTFAVASRRPFQWDLVGQFPTRDLRTMGPALLVIAAAAVIPGVRRPLQPLGTFLALAAGVLAATWVLRTHPGCYENVLVPVHLSVMGLAAIAYARLITAAAGHTVARRLSLLCGGLLAWQLVLMAWHPLRHLPSAADRAAGDELVEHLRRTPGRVLVSSHPYLLMLAGKPEHVHVQSFMDVVKGANGARERALLAEMDDSLRAFAWDLLVLDTRDWLADGARLAGYRPGGRLIRDPGAFWPVTGMQTRPEVVWIPDPRAADSLRNLREPAMDRESAPR